MTEPLYQIEENGDGLYEVHEPSAEAPITIKDTWDEAVAWVKRMEGEHAPDQSAFHSPDDDH